MQTTSHILMIRPVSFGFNTETAVNNAFQVTGQEEGAQAGALKEFDDFVALLRRNGVDVLVVADTPEPHTPDSIFPNNWISFHADGTVVLYPMFAANRRPERNPAILQQIEQHFSLRNTLDLTGTEADDRFLEGTGSLVLDRDHKIAYACLSPRTHPEVLKAFCEKTGYHPVTFSATDPQGQAIYHTNVMMCVADRYIVVCAECVADMEERKKLIQAIHYSGKELIEITLGQLMHFAGNMLQVQSISGEPLLIMSTQAYGSLSPGHIEKLESYNRILHAPLNTIEANGGGSARCMMAEIFLPEKE